jgi:predicted phosphoribosyltransferase
VGWEVARALEAPLDVVVVRKLGVPGQPELAMGAIAGTYFQTLDEELIAALRIPRAEVQAVTANESAELLRREQLYRGGRPPLDVKGRTIVLVDDGLATGSTMFVAVRCVRSQQPCKIVVAIPVGSVQACRRLRKEADDCVCLATPHPFTSVGGWYTDFRQVTDGEVQTLLANRPREA